MDRRVCKDDDEVLQAIEQKQQFSLAATLWLNGNNIGDDGAKSLSESLKVNSTLTTLNLCENNIGDDGAKPLSESLKVNSTLTYLSLCSMFLF